MFAEGLPVATVFGHRESALGEWGITDEVLLVPSGLPVPIRGTDSTHEYHAHPEHYWLTGLARPGHVLTHAADDGWTLFARSASREQRLWEGDTESLDSLKDRTGIARVMPTWELGPWLAAREGRRLVLLGHPDIEDRPDGYGLDRRPSEGLRLDADASARFRAAVVALRRKKDAAEIDLMRRACAATRAGHLAGMRVAHAGMTERELQAEIEVEFLRAGGTRPAYDSIVAAGPNPAVLHFAPSDRPLETGDIVLVDAAAEYGGLMSDVTRTWPVAREFTPQQRDIYELVLSVQEAAIRDARPGKEYRILHLEACDRIASGLVELGILRGDPEGLVDRDAHALFFPHGLGHLIGLATHDAGGYLEDRERSERFGLKYLRTDLPLEPGHVVTIEPGIYFIPALLADPDVQREHRDTVNWDVVRDWLGFGGVRIEDIVHVTPEGSEVLTKDIPKARSEVEALRNG